MKFNYDKIAQRCDTCPALDLYVDKHDLISGNDIIERTVTMVCANKNICENIKQHLECDLASELFRKYRWIPVEERLPLHPEYDWVLVKTKFSDGSLGVPRVAELRGGVWYGDDTSWPLEETLGLKIVAWFDMKLIGD